MAEAISGANVTDLLLFISYYNDFPLLWATANLLYATGIKLITLRNQREIFQSFLKVSASWAND